MPLTDALLPEFDREMGVTRRMLACVPMTNGDWKPHAKSRSMRELASHMANIPRLGTAVLELTELETGPTYKRLPDCTTTEELLARFDEHTAKTRAALIGKSDAEFAAPWTMKHEGRDLFTMPKSSAWRNFMISHLVHHRGQLTIYMRLNDIPVPSIYGPSADDRGF